MAVNTTLTVEQLNNFLSHLDEWTLKNKFSQVAKTESSDYNNEKDQGETGECVEVYRLGVDDLHLKIVRESDSYGDNEHVTQIKFVVPVVKQITDFE